MQVHFFHPHIQDTMVILEEVNLPHPRCPCWDMMVTCSAMTGRHLVTAQCTKGD